MICFPCCENDKTRDDTAIAGSPESADSADKSEKTPDSSQSGVIDAVIAEVNAEYASLEQRKRVNSANPDIERLQRLLIGYDQIYKTLFGFDTNQLKCQKSNEAIVEHVMRSRWFNEFLIPVTGKPVYEYAENVSLRIAIATHAGSAFFDLPYPTLICLLFRESKFDAKALSPTGALGLGQLTSIGLSQLQKLRGNSDEEKRIQDAARHISDLYRHEQMLEILYRLGFQPDLPDLGPFPNHIERINPVTRSFIEDVASELIQKGYAFGNDFDLIGRLVKREFRGEVLRGRYAAVHPVVLNVVDRRYGRRYGNVFNIETNILASCMLLRYYFHYPWRINGEKIRVRPCLRSLLAIAAYNQGPTPVSRFLEYVSMDSPNLDLENATADDLKPLFTKARISKSLKGRYRRAGEIYHHVVNIRACSEKGK